MRMGDMKITVCGQSIELNRKQWRGRNARISNYSGLLDQVTKHTWTYSAGLHPYLRSAELNMSLHKFVLSFLYGSERLEKLLAENNVIDHIDNDGLNCCYDNLHVISDRLNKGKAFTVDNRGVNSAKIPTIVTDVFILIFMILPDPSVL